MIRTVCATLALALTLIAGVSSGAEGTRQGAVNPAGTTAVKQYPQIVLFSVAWCPHCREAKEYLVKNNIPFINRDVELDSKAMDDLTLKYNSTGVPVLVIGTGKDETVMKGFTPELFQSTLQKFRSK
ncbi:MAG: glutaredoxin domain-containing protein [Desulfuromonadaceae bacterium]|nr:glutaredoxin domain-containing protein [Desulfuromonadaceae bacterium]